MKKTCLIICILFAAFVGTAFTQTGTGAMWIGGTAGFESSGGKLYSNDERTTYINFSPVINYFVVPNIFIGPALSYDRWAQGDHSQSELGIGARVGCAFGGKGKSSIPYLKGDLRFTSYALYGETTSSGTTIVLGGGVCFLVAKHAGITAELSYHIVGIKTKGADKTVSGNIISIGFGVVGLIPTR